MSAPALCLPETTLPALRASRKWLRLLVLLVLLSVVITAFTCNHCWGDWKRQLITFCITFAYSAGLWLTNGFAVNWLNRYASWKENLIKRLLLTLLVSLFGSLLVIVAINAVYRMILLDATLASLVAAPAWERYAFPLLITVICSLVMHSRSFLLSWREALLRNERLQKEMAQAEAETLRQQLDPHFLFNSLNALTSLVEEEPQLAVRFIRQLSQVYRYVLDARGREVVSLRDELEFAESFLFLQRIRYGEALQVTLPTPDSVPPQAVVPPLSLQLLIENALKHNVATASQPLQLRIELDESGRQLRVQNTLRPRRVAPGESMGIGLPNLTARYRHLTQQPVQVVRSDAEFVVTLPVLELTTA
ncbi:sensor histidine kinase [Hymenobacter sp. BT730]|uniref:sensor histidine kinase n=1 Tax=Hymenobacter sp. BT730 TaxID=3063332 RepID=UPI0026DF5DE0|nr:histidine kinase [Hymenobacter sp. BT730]